MITLTPLEWRGFEVAVAEMLGLNCGCGRLLRLICQIAPRLASKNSLRLLSAPGSVIDPDTTDDNVKVRVCNIRRGIADHYSTVVAQRIKELRMAAVDIGMPLKIETVPGYGYRMTREDADMLIRYVMEYVGQLPITTPKEWVA